MKGPDADDVRRQVSLVELVRSSVELKPKGPQQWTGLCPLHAEKTPSFTVFLGRDGVERFACFGCGAKGDVLDFLVAFERITFKEALERLAGGALLIGPPPPPPRRKSHALPCEGKGCTTPPLEVDVRDLPYLGHTLYAAWRFDPQADTVRALCPRCCIKLARQARETRRAA